MAGLTQTPPSEEDYKCLEDLVFWGFPKSMIKKKKQNIFKSGVTTRTSSITSQHMRVNLHALSSYSRRTRIRNRFGESR
jgi:hypothetical protein